MQKPITWFNKPAQFILLLNIDKKGEKELKRMYEVLVRILDDPKIVNDLIKCRTFEELRGHMKAY